MTKTPGNNAPRSAILARNARGLAREALEAVEAVRLLRRQGANLLARRENLIAADERIDEAKNSLAEARDYALASREASAWTYWNHAAAEVARADLVVLNQNA